MTTQQWKESYETVDEILGDPGSRYFGGGYRSVQQRVFDVRLDTRNRTAHALAQVTYPKSWSTRNDRELKPHLSSIDGFVIASQLVESYLREAYGLDDGSARDAWIRHCTIKSGSAPTLELERIPVALALVATQADPGTLCGFRSDFRVKVGSLSVELSLDHSLFVARKVNVAFADVSACLGEGEQRYLAGGYKRTNVEVTQISLSSAHDHARARFRFGYASDNGRDGLSGSYLPCISIPDALVGTAQLAQAVLYRRDDLTRATSGNMWMRKISVTIAQPAPDECFDVETWVAQAHVLPIGDRRLRTAKFKVVLPSMEAEFSLAHELPADRHACEHEAAMAQAV